AWESKDWSVDLEGVDADPETRYLVRPYILERLPTVLFGPGECIAGGTVIQGPEGEATVASLAAAQQPFPVWALDGGIAVVAWAEVPYIKGTENLCKKVEHKTEKKWYL
ncbi:hypothetical protein LCGC14_2461690, partial [marine sediment metagenome]